MSLGKTFFHVNDIAPSPRRRHSATNTVHFMRKNKSEIECDGRKRTIHLEGIWINGYGCLRHSHSAFASGLEWKLVSIPVVVSLITNRLIRIRDEFMIESGVGLECRVKTFTISWFSIKIYLTSIFIFPTENWKWWENKLMAQKLFHFSHIIITARNL